MIAVSGGHFGNFLFTGQKEEIDIYSMLLLSVSMVYVCVCSLAHLYTCMYEWELNVNVGRLFDCCPFDVLETVSP